jgi:hypothetical protein
MEVNVADEILDLYVAVALELTKLSDNHAHPASKNALINGVITGLSFGQVWVEASRLHRIEIPEPKLTEILSDVTTSVPDLIHDANEYMPVGESFTSALFCRLNYRSGTCPSNYGQGIKMGFEYCMKIYMAMAPSHLSTALDHIEVVMLEISTL